MRIVHLASEFAPIAKAGGLGEVVIGLSREQTRLGHTVDIIIPKYDFIDLTKLPQVKMEVPDFKSLGFANTMWSATVEECHLHLLDARHPSGYFHRKKIYGEDDDIPRFIYFCRAALDYLRLQKQAIDVLHLHDWHTSLAAILVKDLFTDLNIKKIILSIHSIEHQGKCAINDLDAVGLHGASYLTSDKMQDNNLKYPQTINLLKGGIVYADTIVPVSPTYAKEILTPEYGFGLDATLKQMPSKIRGILNGIDTVLWNPSKDPYLPTTYSIESVLKAKQTHKAKFKGYDKHLPWVGAITRLAPQKGPELIEAALKKTIELGGSFFLLGSSSDPSIQQRFDKLKDSYKNHPQVFLHYHYDEALAHLLYAALDFLIVPSHYEPCGLTQLIAMNYGTVPIVRETGGLKDTVFDFDDPKIPASCRNGFTFAKATTTSMSGALERAFQLFKKDPTSFQLLIRRGMQSDFSWKKPTQEYLKLY